MSHVLRFAKSSQAIEAGFLAAGVTVTTLGAVQALATVVSWIS
jgi:hypothetical protein